MPTLHIKLNEDDMELLLRCKPPTTTWKEYMKNAAWFMVNLTRRPKRVDDDAPSKPCLALGFCPYGQSVEAFPVNTTSKNACKLFGRDCPVFYMAEKASELEAEQNLVTGTYLRRPVPS